MRVTLSTATEEAKSTTNHGLELVVCAKVSKLLSIAFIGPYLASLFDKVEDCVAVPSGAMLLPSEKAWSSNR
eukprot:scaffold173026_cov103-Cyclotella_meneghiniana.AAC.2